MNKAKIIETEKTDNGISYRIEFNSDMTLWFDTWLDNNELTGDWNKYIFHLNNSEDVKIKAFQENANNFETAINLCHEA